MSRAKPSLVRRMLFSIIKIALGVFFGFGILLLFAQNSLIYYPSRYPAGMADGLAGEGVVKLSFETSEGRQEAYWFRPVAREAAIEDVTLPENVWLTFGGNAAQALGWVDFLKLYRGPSAGFLLIEYPGYGDCDGSPSPASILESTEAAVAALCGFLECDETTLRPRLAVLGQSLGAAAGLQAAERFGISRIVLISPFTSLKAMARRVVGPVYAPLLRHAWDNVKRLESLCERGGVRVRVVHGASDIEVPASMSRELAERFPDMVALEVVPDMGHNDLVYGASAIILRKIGELSLLSPRAEP